MLFRTTGRPKLFRNSDCHYIKYTKKKKKKKSEKQSKAFHLHNQNPIFFFISFPQSSTHQSLNLLFKTTRRPKLFRNLDCHYIKYTTKNKNKNKKTKNRAKLFIYIIKIQSFSSFLFPTVHKPIETKKKKLGHVPYLDYIEKVNNNSRREKRCRWQRQLAFQTPKSPQSHLFNLLSKT